MTFIFRIISASRYAQNVKHMSTNWTRHQSHFGHFGLKRVLLTWVIRLYFNHTLKEALGVAIIFQEYVFAIAQLVIATRLTKVHILTGGFWP